MDIASHLLVSSIIGLGIGLSIGNYFGSHFFWVVFCTALTIGVDAVLQTRKNVGVVKTGRRRIKEIKPPPSNFPTEKPPDPKF